ncbi:MAG: RHS repeat-associated core domain-containing protein, partial [Gemmataceae bacterium]
GSVRLVVDAATGSVAQRIDYDEFGRVLVDTSPGFQPFGFAGGLYDRDTGLVRFGARDYDAEAGRWTAQDPIGFAGRQSNLYAYVNNNPVTFTDPSGLCPADDERERLRELKRHLEDLWDNLVEKNGAPRSQFGFEERTPRERQQLADQYGQLIDKLERQLNPDYNLAKHLGF